MPPHRRRMITWIGYLALGAVGFWLFFRWFEYSNVYQPSHTWYTDGSQVSPKWEAVTFSTDDGVSLSGWFFPAPTPSPWSQVAVLTSHGNGGNISHRLGFYELLLQLGVNVLAYDYRGYGRSQGRPSEDGTYRDAEAALAYLRTRGFSEEQVVAHGESLGGGIAAELALRHPKLRGVVLQSTFTGIADLGTELFPFLPVRTISRIRYTTVEKLPRIQIPVLLLHSREDTLVAFRHAERNFAAAREPKWLREIRGDHNDQPDASPDLHLSALRTFLVDTSPKTVVPTVTP